MLIRLFKIITSLLLVGVLFILITKRDFYYIPLQKTLFPQKKSVTTVEVVTAPLPIQNPTTSSTTAPLKPEAVTSTTTQEPPLPKVAVTEKTGVYEHLNEGPSDTDESYHPIVSPCTTPMGYKIGTFDSRFGISRTMFLQEIKQASEVWGDAVGKTLFYYDEKGPLTINLIYDERQARTEDINYLAMEIENSKQSADQIKQFYEQEKASYLADAEQLTKDNENFQMRYKAYTEKVATYNAAGGAVKIEYDAMMQELDTLKQEAKTLEQRRATLLVTMESINKKVAKYNELIVYINGLIRRSNALGAKKFTEGRFSSANNTIDIFQYNDSIKLRRVVTHELGHVLGINHTKNIYSIMYAVNSATTTTLTKEDREALNAVCPFQ
jgi:FtsZ-binding cell division protein ZapB